MNEILSQFSINPVALLAHIVNFILVFIIIYKVLLKKMFVYIEDQKKEIEQGIALKFDFEKKNTEFEIHSKKLLNEAKRESLAIIEEAKKKAFLEHEKESLKLQEELQKNMSNFKEIIEREKSHMFSEMKQEITGMSKKIATEYYHELREKTKK